MPTPIISKLTYQETRFQIEKLLDIDIVPTAQIPEVYQPDFHKFMADGGRGFTSIGPENAEAVPRRDFTEWWNEVYYKRGTDYQIQFPG